MSALREAYAVPDGRAPHVRVNVISSIDGAATLGGHSGGLGDAADRATMQALRANADVVLVGAGTILAEGYGGMRLSDDDAAWRHSAGMPAQPRIAVLSGSLSVPPQHPVFVDAVTRPLVLAQAEGARVDDRPIPAGLGSNDAPRVGGGPDVGAADPALRGLSPRAAAYATVAEVILFADLPDAIAQLARAAGRRILCEGGPTLFAALMAADLVDEVCVTISPQLVGGEGPRVASGPAETVRRMALHDVRRVGDELFLRYARP